MPILPCLFPKRVRNNQNSKLACMFVLQGSQINKPKFVISQWVYAVKTFHMYGPTTSVVLVWLRIILLIIS